MSKINYLDIENNAIIKYHTILKSQSNLTNITSRIPIDTLIQAKTAMNNLHNQGIKLTNLSQISNIQSKIDMIRFSQAKSALNSIHRLGISVTTISQLESIASKIHMFTLIQATSVINKPDFDILRFNNSFSMNDSFRKYENIDDELNIFQENNIKNSMSSMADLIDDVVEYNSGIETIIPTLKTTSDELRTFSSPIRNISMEQSYKILMCTMGLFVNISGLYLTPEQLCIINSVLLLLNCSISLFDEE